MLPNVKCLTFAGMSAIVVLCQRPHVILTSLKPWRICMFLYLELTWYPQRLGFMSLIKTNALHSVLVEAMFTLARPPFQFFFFFLFPFLIKTDMSVVVFCLNVFSP
jgi:hypothetical protein